MKKPFSSDLLIMGSQCIQEVLRHAPQKLVHLYVAEPKKKIYEKECLRLRLPLSVASLDRLTQMVQSDSHQGVVAEISPRSFWDLPSFLKQSTSDSSFLLLLDQIFDPQNFGAILRSAECFGVSGVIWSKNRGTGLTPVVAKTSCGASEFLDLIRVSNLANAIEQLQEQGYEVIAAILDPKAESAYTFQYSAKTALILGSEGEGIQPLLCKNADRSIYLPMKGKIGSLNVAQTASALLALHAGSFKKQEGERGV